MKKLFIKITCFLLITLLVSLLLNAVMTPKRDLFPYNTYEKIRGFYAEKEDSLDIVFVGPSTLFTTMNPAVLWKEQGITSYVFAANEQNLHLSYYFVKEALKSQTPDAIVLDTYYIAFDAEPRLEVQDINLDNIKFGLNKLEAINNIAKPSLKLTLLLPLITYNDRWNELRKEDFEFLEYKKDPFKGWTPYSDSEFSVPKDGDLYYSEGLSLEVPSDIYSEEVKSETLPQKSLGWLEDIEKLCLDNNIELILITTPNNNQISLPIFDGEGYEETDGSGYYKALEEYAKEKGLTYINMNGIMPGAYHNAISTANKASSWFGRWYTSCHVVEDKRNNPTYDSWDEAADLVYSFKKENYVFEE